MSKGMVFLFLLVNVFHSRVLKVSFQNNRQSIILITKQEIAFTVEAVRSYSMNFETYTRFNCKLQSQSP